MKTFMLSLLLVAMVYYFYAEAIPAPAPAEEPLLLSSLADASREKRQAPAGKFAANIGRCCGCPTRTTTIIVTTIIISGVKEECCPCTGVSAIQPSQVEK
ncbi:uncharacterized protein [Palaemon carinicauda]|uniref:uncharacterized protein n=1 Tax=Palaemon carinicauda TaxID=392227 RepID=UPI0035B633FB